MKKIIYITALILLCITSLLYVSNLKEKYIKAEANVKALTSQVDTLRTKNGELWYRSQSLQLSVDDLKKTNSDLIKKIKQLEIKPSKIEYISEGQLTIRVTDTVFLEADDNGIYYGQWSDPWTNAYFECKDSVLKFDYTTQDSLMLILYGQKEKFNIFHPFRKRLTSYYSVAKLTRPNSTLIVKSIKFK